MWCIPPKQNAEFVAHMEDVLSVYAVKTTTSKDNSFEVVTINDEKLDLLAEEYAEENAIMATEGLEISLL